jgi:hypothetical protein
MERKADGTFVEIEYYRTYVIDNAVLNMSTGERGYLAVQFAMWK